MNDEQVMRLDECRQKFEELEFRFKQLKKDHLTQIDMVEVKLQMMKAEMIRIIQRNLLMAESIRPSGSAMNKNFAI